LVGEHERRCLAAQLEMAGYGFDFLLVAPSSDLTYLTGVADEPSERLMMLVLRLTGQPALVVPRLEAEKVSSLVPFASLHVWEETESPFTLVASLLGEDGLARPTVAIDEHMWAGTLLGLQAVLPGANYRRANPLLSSLRVIKSRAEVELLRSAAAKADVAYGRLLREPLVGLAEVEVADLVGRHLRAAGLEKVSFVIVGSGPNGAKPHHWGGDRRLAVGDAVVLDFGGTYRHYQSDITRTVVVGAPATDLANVHRLVREAQEAAFQAVKPGVSAGQVDAAARQRLAAAGLGEYFIHRTGHGLGLDLHEEPYIVAGNDLPLREGMVFSLEPGVYLPGRFGVRVEDIVVVTATGAERLNNAPRELAVIGTGASG
jgi:Xaa-Pro aminopeptidase